MTPHISVSLLGTQSDERLASLAGSGHERAFEAIVERYSKALTRYAQRFLGEARAEEVVQAAFLSAWSALTTGTEVRDLRPWLYRIVHNGALNAMNRSESGDLELIEATDGALSPHAILEQNEEVRSALNVIAELPERQRAALLAVAVDGRAHADVAADLGVSDAGVRQLVRRARVQLRTAATALTPLPLALWLADAQRAPSPDVSHRIAEILADGGGNALAASAMKAGAVVVSVAAVATAAPKVSDVVKQSAKSEPAAAVIGVSAAGTGTVGANGGPIGLATGFGLGSGGPSPAGEPPREGGLNAGGDAEEGFGALPGAPEADDPTLANGRPGFRGRRYAQDMNPLFPPGPGNRRPRRGGESGSDENSGRGNGGRNRPLPFPSAEPSPRNPDDSDGGGTDDGFSRPDRSDSGRDRNDETSIAPSRPKRPGRDGSRNYFGDSDTPDQ